MKKIRNICTLKGVNDKGWMFLQPGVAAHLYELYENSAEWMEIYWKH